MPIIYENGVLKEHTRFVGCHNIDDPNIKSFVESIVSLLKKEGINDTESFIKSLCEYKFVTPINYIQSYDENRTELMNIIGSKLPNSKSVEKITEMIYDKAKEAHNQIMKAYMDKKKIEKMK